MLNVDYSTADDAVSWLSGGVTVIRFTQAHEVVVHGHNGVFWVRGFHGANSRYAAEVLSALLGEEAAGISLKVCARGNVGGLRVDPKEPLWLWFPAFFFFFFSSSFPPLVFSFCPSVRNITYGATCVVAELCFAAFSNEVDSKCPLASACVRGTPGPQGQGWKGAVLDAAGQHCKSTLSFKFWVTSVQEYWCIITIVWETALMFIGFVFTQFVCANSHL